MISFAEMFRVFGWIGLMSYGGPAAQIALMHKVLVDERKWLADPAPMGEPIFSPKRGLARITPKTFFI